MGKVFVEYQLENGMVPYSGSELCYCLTQYAKDYIKSNRPVTLGIDKKIRDAVLVDAINYLGIAGYYDYALYTNDLYEERCNIYEKDVEAQCLLTVSVNHFSYYMFNEGIVESVLRNNHMNDCTEAFDANDGALVLLDFINYIAERNEYDRKFTIKDLYQKFKMQEHNIELKQLRRFLELTGEYNEKLASGNSIDTIYKNMARKHNLKCITEDGTYLYDDYMSSRLGHSEMYYGKVATIEREIYAMAYAYGKLNTNQESSIPIIDKKILEMKNR